MTRIALQNNWLRGFKINNEGLEISHLLYADDTLIFCEAKEDQVKFFRVMPVVFEAALVWK